MSAFSLATTRDWTRNTSTQAEVLQGRPKLGIASGAEPLTRSFARDLRPLLELVEHHDIARRLALADDKRGAVAHPREAAHSRAWRKIDQLAIDLRTIGLDDPDGGNTAAGLTGDRQPLPIGRPERRPVTEGARPGRWWRSEERRVGKECRS